MKPLYGLALAAVVLVFVTAACGLNPSTAPTTYAPFTKTDLVVGSGAEAAAGQTLVVKYTGWLYDELAKDHKGPQFGTSSGTGVSITLGAGQVIAGWDEGIPGMKVGGIRQLIIPPSLGYGGTRNGPIPPNATLLFEIELVKIGT